MRKLNQESVPVDEDSKEYKIENIVEYVRYPKKTRSVSLIILKGRLGLMSTGHKPSKKSAQYCSSGIQVERILAGFRNTAIPPCIVDEIFKKRMFTDQGKVVNGQLDKILKTFS